MQHVGGRCDHENLYGHPAKDINQGRFELEQNEAERQRGFTEESICCSCVYASWPSLTLSHSTNKYISGNKRKRKQADCLK